MGPRGAGWGCGKGWLVGFEPTRPPVGRELARGGPGSSGRASPRARSSPAGTVRAGARMRFAYRALGVRVGEGTRSAREELEPHPRARLGPRNGHESAMAAMALPQPRLAENSFRRGEDPAHGLALESPSLQIGPPMHPEPRPGSSS